MILALVWICGGKALDDLFSLICCKDPTIQGPFVACNSALAAVMS